MKTINTKDEIIEMLKKNNIDNEQEKIEEYKNEIKALEEKNKDLMEKNKGLHQSNFAYNQSISPDLLKISQSINRYIENSPGINQE